MTRARHRTALGALIALVLMAPAAHASSFWGVDGAAMLQLSPAAAAGQLALTHGLGIGLARFAVTADPAAQIAALAENGIEPYPTLSGGYGAFAARYGVGGSALTAVTDPVHVYEIGNEPNIGETPAQYAATYRTARAQIQAHDPGAEVVAGGLAAIFFNDSFDVYDWTRQMIAALGACPDAIGYHAYPDSLAELAAGLQAFRLTLDEAGCPATTIELNEFYMIAADPLTLSETLAWLETSDIGLSRVMMFMWGAAGSAPRGLNPLETPSGTVTALGSVFLLAVRDDPAPAGAISAAPSTGAPATGGAAAAGGGTSAPDGSSRPQTPSAGGTGTALLPVARTGARHRHRTATHRRRRHHRHGRRHGGRPRPPAHHRRRATAGHSRGARLTMSGVARALP